jgi:geranylgeranyl pyrophosphate synthase
VTLSDLTEWLEESRRWAEGELERWIGEGIGWPESLREAMRYSLFCGGKRLRPALVRLFCESFGGSVEAASRPAAAIEMIHTYSLIHDDLPCMDDDDLRRGQPTSHKVFGEAFAVLAGDALLTEALALLATAPERGAELVRVLAIAAGAGGMVGGQVLDLSTGGARATIEEVRAVHQAKTGALLGAACELGGIAAGASPDRLAGAAQYGRALGLLFQAVDDILDVTEEATTLGKTPGKDAELDRATSVAALGLEGAREEATRLADDTMAIARRIGFGVEELPLLLVERVLARRS